MPGLFRNRTSEVVDQSRRSFLGTAAMTMTAAQLPRDRTLSARIRHDSFSFKRNDKECSTVGGCARYHCVDRCTQDRKPGSEYSFPRLADRDDLKNCTLTPAFAFHSVSEAVCAAVLLRAPERPDARRHHMDAWQNGRHEFLQYGLGILMRLLRYSGTHRHQRRTTSEEHHPLCLKLIDTDASVAKPWQHEITGLGLPEDVAHRSGLCLGIGDLRRFSEFVLLPQIVTQREGNCFVPDDRHDAAILCRRTGARVGHQKDHRPQKWKEAVRLENIENGTMLSLDPGKPGVRIFRICSNGCGLRGCRS